MFLFVTSFLSIIMMFKFNRKLNYIPLLITVVTTGCFFSVDKIGFLEIPGFLFFYFALPLFAFFWVAVVLDSVPPFKNLIAFLEKDD